MSTLIIRYGIFGLLIFLFLAIQTSGLIAVFDVNPDILLLTTILFSVYYGEFKGEIFGFILGFLVDVLSGTIFGTNAFIFTLIAWLTSVYKRYVFISDIVAFLIYVALATILKYILYPVFHLIFAKSGFFDGFYLLKMIGEMTYNSLIGLLFFYLAPMLLRKEETPY
jgi:rod shape-determining protein MreD